MIYGSIKIFQFILSPYHILTTKQQVDSLKHDNTLEHAMAPSPYD